MKTILGSRKQRYMVRVGIFLVMAALIMGMAGCPACTDTTSSAYVEIEDWYDLHALRDNLRGSYILMKDLDKNTLGYVELASPTANGEKGWEPIRGFKGSFDGQGKQIEDLFIKRPDEEEVGLFGYVERGVVQNVGVVGTDVTGQHKVGGLVGWNWGTVTTAYSSGTVSASGDSAGGLVGHNNHTVTNGESSATVSGKNSVGGLVGMQMGTGLVSNSGASGTVSGSSGVGGLVGINYYRVANSNASGAVSGSSGVGGLVGRNFGRVTHSDSNGNVNGNSNVAGILQYNLEGSGSNPLAAVPPDDSDIGGLVGHNGAEAVVSESYSTGSVTGTSNVGGLTGLNKGAIDDCHSSGDVTGTSRVGRLVGYNTGTLSNSYSESWVSGTFDGGDLVGENEGRILYDLTIASTTGGSATTPGEGTFAYDAGTVVKLVATPASGYQFVNWTGDVDTVADVTAASTTITMNRKYSITANFDSPDEQAERMVIRLDFVTFWPATDFQAAIGHENWMKTISDRVLAETDDYEIIWDAYYAGTASPRYLWELVAWGLYDVAATVTGYSPDVFPLWQGPEYPGELYRNNAYTMSLTVQALHDQMPVLQGEITGKGLKLMHFWSTGPGCFLMTPGNEVRTLADFPGKTIRAHNLPSVTCIEALGAEPVVIAMSEALEMFEAGLLNGMLCPGDVPKGFGLGAYVRHCTSAPFSYQSVYMKVMNEATWNALPAEVQTIFDDVNAAWPEYYGKLRTWGEAEGLEYMKGLEGFTYYDPRAENPAEYARMVAATEGLIDDWIGGDATRQALWDRFVELDEYYATTEPWSTWTPDETPPPVPTFP